MKIGERLDVGVTIKTFDFSVSPIFEGFVIFKLALSNLQSIPRGYCCLKIRQLSMIVAGLPVESQHPRSDPNSGGPVNQTLGKV